MNSSLDNSQLSTNVEELFSSQVSHKKTERINGRNIHLRISGEACARLLVTTTDEGFEEETEIFLLQLVRTISKLVQHHSKHYLKEIILSRREALSNVIEALGTLDVDDRTAVSMKDPGLVQFDLGDQSMTLTIIPTPEEFSRLKAPHIKFYELCNNLTIQYAYKQPKQGDPASGLEKRKPRWTKTLRPDNIIRRLLKTDSREEEIATILDGFDEQDLKRYGKNLISMVEAMKLPKIDPNERPDCFPFWTEGRIQELEHSHAICIDTLRKQMTTCLREDEDCNLCHEYCCLMTLRWWYYEIFCKKDEKIKLTCANGDIKEDLGRLKGLVVKGERDSGKTKWFEAICKFLPHRVCTFKNRPLKEDSGNINSAWLILIDDYHYNPNDLQMMKALLVGEKTAVMGKWLAKKYYGGIPCIVLCNEDEFYLPLREIPEFRSQCKFIDLKNLYIGPAGTEETKKTKITGLQFVELPSQTMHYEFSLRKEKRVKESENTEDEVGPSKKVKKELEAYKATTLKLRTEREALKGFMRNQGFDYEQLLQDAIANKKF